MRSCTTIASNDCSKLQPSPPTKIKFYSYVVENSQIARLNFYFKSRFSVKPTKFQIHFAKAVASKFSLKTDNFDILDQIFPKKGISDRKQKKTVNIDNLHQICPRGAFLLENKKILIASLNSACSN